MAAVDAENWQEACDLTDIRDDDACVIFTRRLFESVESVTLGGLSEGAERTRFAIEAGGSNSLTGFGQLTVFEDEGRFFVHLEGAAVD